MEGPGVLIQVAQFYAWAVFLCSWGQMGWVDWREQKIRNHYVKFWLKLVLAGYALLLVQSVLGELGVIRVFIVRGWYLALLEHAAFSVAAAYALWRLRIWPAGDVKLFVLLALCYPLMRIPGSFRSGLLFLEVLINVFVPAAAFLFLTAGQYLWQTRFAHYTAHAASYLRKVRLPRVRFPSMRLPEVSFPEVRVPDAAPAFRLPVFDLGSFSFESLAVSLPGFDVRTGARAVFTAIRLKSGGVWDPVKRELGGLLQGYRERPWQLALDVLSWLSMMAVMSMISYYLTDVIKSNVLKTLVCFALMFTWSRICQFIGTGWALGVVFGVLSVVLWRRPNLDFPALAVIFGHITIFSLFIMLGIQLAFRIIAGKTAFLIMPFMMLLIGVIPWRAIVRTLWSWAMIPFTWLLSLSLPRMPALPSLPSAPPAPPPPPVPSMPGMPAIHFSAVHLPWPHFGVPAWAAQTDFASFQIWAVMGLFFGLALVFVKIWDNESYKSVPVAHIDKFMTLGPELVARIEADPDFRDEHFATFYADGLTGEQAEALREWCAEEGLETVPLAPTISFANWIFLGYFLTRLLEGHVLRFLY
jgi:hypothetical protein